MVDTPLFYRRLLDLQAHLDPLPLLEETLRLAVPVTNSRFGYIELSDKPQFWRSHGIANQQCPTQSPQARRVLDHVIATDRSLLTSVGGGAVLCAPISGDSVVGAVYFASAAKWLASADVEHIELLARHLAPVAMRVIARRRTLREQTLAFKKGVIRETLRRNEWNVTSTAKELGLGRAAVYRVMRRK